MNEFESVLTKQKSDVLPVWIMRQAGRILPEYMELRKKYSFKQLMETPELAAKVTLMPIEKLGVDAAILFSDILVVPQALGLDLHFTDQGPVFENPLIKFSEPEKVIVPQPEKLDFVYKTIEIFKQKTENKIPLIGFCGGPLTVLLYMLEGLGTKSDFKNAEKFIFSQKKTVEKIVSKIEVLTLQYVENQLISGVDCFRLFESNCGNVPFYLYKEIFLPVVEKICNLVRKYNKKFIFFPKGIGLGLTEISPNLCDYLALDWQTDIYSARRILNSEIGIEGNFDPRILLLPQNEIRKNLEYYRLFAKQNDNWIFNLGHGVLPQTPWKNVKFLVDEVKMLKK